MDLCADVPRTRPYPDERGGAGDSGGDHQRAARRARGRAATVVDCATGLGRGWFARETVTVARELIGCTLVVDRGTAEEVRARIVETEAYLGTSDPASHAFRGPTPRAAIMFGPAGHLYVYLSYGVHHCANLVTEADGTAGAALLRAAEVVAGDAVVRRRRGATVAAEALLRGPGNLCRGLGLALPDNGTDVCGADRVTVLPAAKQPDVCCARRVGISAAADEPLRFAWRDHPAVSRPAPSTQKKGPAMRALESLPLKRQPGGKSRA